MSTAGRGAIVNLASISMWFGFPRRLSCFVSEAGIGGLTQTLAIEWASTAFASVRLHAV
jgi:NAD(P)-dependent dehydrogenase (short-subunit alcohol dehydrogenase family)